MVASPYGFWTSPITSDLVVADSIRLDQVALDGDAIYWSETQPQKQGRTFVYRIGADGEPKCVTPNNANAYSVRSRAHEYGGGSFAVNDGVVYFSNNLDQRLYRQDAGGPPRPITPAPTGAAADALRYADGVIDWHRGRMVCVREDHTVAGEAITTLVGVNLSGATVPQVLLSGSDFYSTPRLSPDGNRMSWLTWRHPDMPWVTTEAWVGAILPDGTIGSARRVAGGPNESVFQPEWSPDGNLYFVSDRGSGWWNLYRERDGAIEPMAEMDAEFGRPQWQFGMSTYAFESADRLIACSVRDGVWTLVGIDSGSERFDVIPTEFTDIAQVRAAPGRVVFIGGSPSEAPALVDLDLNKGTHRVLRRSFALREDVRCYVSAPQPIAFPTGGGETAHALYYPPFSPEFAAPADEKAPVLVKSHGGPTSAASSTLLLSTQYWTSRGVGVLDVNYRGSTGYGRPYRLRLEQQWGLVDVEDCVAGAGPGRIRLAEVSDYSANSLHPFVTQNLAPGATAKTDGWSAYPGAPGVDHDPHVIGKMAAHIVLPWVHRIFSNSKYGVWASITACAASISNPTSTSSSSASTAAAPGTPPSAPCLASPPATRPSPTKC